MDCQWRCGLASIQLPENLLPCCCPLLAALGRWMSQVTSWEEVREYQHPTLVQLLQRLRLVVRAVAMQGGASKVGVHLCCCGGSALACPSGSRAVCGCVSATVAALECVPKPVLCCWLWPPPFNALKSPPLLPAARAVPALQSFDSRPLVNQCSELEANLKALDAAELAAVVAQKRKEELKE